VPGEGARDPKWIAVGEGPGRVELQEGRPFVGPSGGMLMRVLHSVEVERADVWITNATLCAPRSKTLDEMTKARECCKPRLDAELAGFAGKPILAMGAIAAHTLLGDHYKISEMAGALQEVDVDGTGKRDIIATHHPARILRGGDGEKASDRAVDLLFWNLIYDAAKVNALADGRQVRFSDDVEIEAYDRERAHDLMLDMHADVLKRKHCAIDVETDGLNARKVGLTAIAISTTEWSLSLAYPMFVGGIGDETWKLFRSIYVHASITKVFHNRLFDELVLRRYGLRTAGPVQDTLLKHHAAFPGQSHKLQDVATQFFAIRPWKSEFRRGTDDKGRPDSIDNLLTYNARDTLVTARLDPVLDDCLIATNTADVYEADNSLAPIAMNMEVIGVPIDCQRNAELREHFAEIIERTRTTVERTASDPKLREGFLDQLALIRALKKRKYDPGDFLARHAKRYDELKNGIRKKKKPDECLKGKEPVQFAVSNPDHIAAYLKARGHSLWKVTKGGKPSTAKDVLEGLAHIEDVRTILEFREAAKLQSTFVVGLPIERSRQGSRWGRLHSSWDIHKITGRWGSSPNIQNWPKANMRGRPNLRSQVVAPPGRKLVGADYAQLEARIIGMMSADPFLVSVFMDGFGDCEAGCRPDIEPIKFCPEHDLHTVFAVEVFAGFQDYGKDEKKELRDLTKRGEYGGFYGGADETLYQSIVKEFPDVTQAAVAKITSTIRERMPGVEAWHHQLVRDAMSGEIRSAIFGRRRTFPLGNAEMTVVYNFPVQATGADIIDMGIIELDPLLPRDAHIIIHAHDALVVDCREQDAEHVAKQMTAALSMTVEFNGVEMFYPANAEIGDSWTEI
jgi:uracil-DNA glycosylase family 4